MFLKEINYPFLPQKEEEELVTHDCLAVCHLLVTTDRLCITYDCVLYVLLCLYVVLHTVAINENTLMTN